MKDCRISLLDCKQIYWKLDNDTYRLDCCKLAGRGGSCLVYYGWKLEENGISQRVVIKEFYPMDGDMQRDCGSGELMIRDDDVWMYARKERFLRSYAIFADLCNIEELNQFVVRALATYHAHGTAYIVTEFGTGCTLQERICDGLSLKEFCGYMITLSKIMGRLHGQGFVHLDLKPSNILCAENAVVEFLDVDSILRIDQMDKGCSLSFSEGFTAPEIKIYHERGYFRNQGLSVQRRIAVNNICLSDVYSFGAIVYHWLFSSPPRCAFEKCGINREQIAASLRKKETKLPERTISVLSYQFLELLENTMSENISDRYDSMMSVQKMMEDIVNGTNVQIQENFVPNQNVIFGREEKLAELEQLFIGQRVRSGSRIVIISGIGGVGKSSLARKFAEEHRDTYDIIAEVYLSEVLADSETGGNAVSLADDAIQQIEILNWEPDAGLSSSERIRHCKKMLAQLNARYKTLLIVHNYDVSEDPHFSVWKELGCDILLTSRHKWDPEEVGVPVLQLKCSDLSLEQAKEIFAAFYLRKAKEDAHREKLKRVLAEEDETLGKLLQVINFLPLGIQLQAKHMSVIPYGEMLPSQALSELEETGIDPMALEEFPNRSDYGQYRGNLYTHVEIVLHNDLKKTQVGMRRDALRFMTLIPSSYGISKERFEEWTGVKAIHLVLLEDEGWLEFLPGQTDLLWEDSSPGVYVLPTVFQQIIRAEPRMHCTPESCSNFLEICSLPSYMWESIQQRKALYAHQNLLRTYFTGEESCIYINMRLNADTLQSVFDNNYENQAEVIAELQSILSLCGKISGSEFLQAKCHNQLSVLYFINDNTESGLSHLERSTSLYGWRNARTEAFEDEQFIGFFEWYATVVMGIGACCMSAHYISVLCRVVLRLMREETSYSLAVAWVISEIGGYFYDMNEYELAFFFMKSSLMILDEKYHSYPVAIVGKQIPTYIKLGEMCTIKENLEEAQRYLKKALRYCVERYGNDHTVTEMILRKLEKAGLSLSGSSQNEAIRELCCQTDDFVPECGDFQEIIGVCEEWSNRSTDLSLVPPAMKEAFEVIEKLLAEVYEIWFYEA